ncbi:MAG TPA: helix-turn-helix domain-containing protein [Rubricoccaceae bacterium]|jgi:hypothetical protein
MPDRLRLILGVKLRSLRQSRGLGLKAVAKKAGLSVSYLSEIEQGKKYPRAEKLVDLAHALGVPYDDLVSLRVDRGLDAVKDAIESPFLRAFPFGLFGVEPESVVNLLAGMADRGEALVRAMSDLGRAYDGRVEDVLLAALRAYQQMHANRFPDLEAAAERIRTRLRLGPSPTADALCEALEQTAGYRIDTAALAADPELCSLRSVLVPAPDASASGPTLYVNGSLLDEQRAFVYARELGFLELGATHRPLTSSWIQVDRFEQVLDNFRGSYVAGALLLPAAVVDAALVRLADAPTWDATGLGALLARTRSTPEMLFHRLTQRVPEALGLDELFFLRVHQPAGTDTVALTKSFNLSRVPVPHGVADDEHYCRRWADSVALRELDRQEARAAGRGETDGGLVVAAQRQHFLAENAEFFVVSVARPLSLQPGTHSAVSLGVLRTRATRRRIRFWDDPALPLVDVSLTCERCPLTDCRVRAAPPRLLAAAEAARRRTDALAGLAAETPG